MNHPQQQWLSAKKTLKWTSIKFLKHVPGDLTLLPTQETRFCEAVSRSAEGEWILTPDRVCCQGAQRCQPYNQSILWLSRFSPIRRHPARAIGGGNTRRSSEKDERPGRRFRLAVFRRPRVIVASITGNVSCRHMNTNVAIVEIPLNDSTVWRLIPSKRVRSVAVRFGDSSVAARVL